MTEKYEDEFNAFIDEMYKEVEVMGLHYPASRVLKECDPVAWRCGYLDYCDSVGIDIDA